MDAGIEVLIGHPPGQPEAAYAQLLRLVHPKDRRRIVDMLRSAERDKDQLETDFRLKDQSAGTRHIAIRGRIVARDRRARPLEAIGIAFDITNQKTLEEQLLALVMYDSLTGVRNRRSFDHSLRREWNRAGRSRHSLAVLMIDVDYFKLYNDRLGHQAGDDALCAVARALSEALGRETDLLARYGGEEFVALLANATIEQAARIGEHLLASVRALGLPHPASAFECVTVSIGAAALVPGDNVKSHDLLSATDQALYRAKAAGRNRLSA
jgi:diguanylate cyclase (GGDEF)-like protein